MSTQPAREDKTGPAPEDKTETARGNKAGPAPEDKTETARGNKAGPAPEDKTESAREDATARARQDTGAGPTPKGPAPEPIRFFGTTWLRHDGGYAWRRAAVATASLLGALAGALVLRLAYDGVRLAEAGGLVTVLLVGMFALCTVLAFVRTWESYGTRPDPATQQSLRGLLAIGFVGRLFAHFLRCLSEAPGEGLHRAEYEKARAHYERRTAGRAGGRAARPRG